MQPPDLAFSETRKYLLEDFWPWEEVFPKKGKTVSPPHPRGEEDKWRPEGKRLPIHSSTENLLFQQGYVPVSQKLSTLQRAVEIKEVTKQEPNVHNYLFLANLLSAMHEGLPVRRIPTTDEALDIHEPNQSAHTMLQRMKTKV